MAFVVLSIIFIFKCKRYYRSRVLSEMMDKMTDTDGQWTMEDELSITVGEFIFLVCFRQLTNCYISTKHSKLSAIAAGDPSQTTPVHSHSA